MDNRSLAVNTKKGVVPGLHPGLNDLIRILGKQAHCASRTLIVCEPVCPKTTYSGSKYHNNCAPPKKGRSSDSLCRPSSLWSPILPESYYYDCFSYGQYPDRDSEYQEIERKYNAIKQEQLDYSPPKCDENKIKAVVSGGLLNKSGSSKSSAGKGGKGGRQVGVSVDLSVHEAFRNKENLEESSMGSARNQKYPLGSGSKRNMLPEGGSVPCAELAEIRDLLKKSDRETIIRMQEMLTLMKELSVRDICRATCDGSPGGRFQGGGPKTMEGEDDLHLSRESKPHFEEGVDSRKRKENDLDYGYGPQGPTKSYKQREDDYGPQGPKKSYQQRVDGHGPRESKVSTKRGSNSSKRNRGEYDEYDYGNNYDTDHQEPETFYRKGISSKKRKRGTDDDRHESVRGSQQKDAVRKDKNNVDGDGLDENSHFNEENEEHGKHYNAGPHLNVDIQEPSSHQRHEVSPKESRGKLDCDESLSSTTESERSGGSNRVRPSRRGDRNCDAASESDTDLTESSSSIFSESSTPDVSRKGMDCAPDSNSSDVEPEMEAPKKKSSSRRHRGGSISEQESSSSLSESPSEDGSRTAMNQGQKFPEQSRLPVSTNANTPEQPSSGANYKIPVGKKNVPLTVHEVVEISNKITDIIVFEVVDELIKRGLYFPQSSRNSQGHTGATAPTPPVLGQMKPTSSRQELGEQKAYTKDFSGYKETSREFQLKPTGSTRLSRIDESSSRKLDASNRDMKQEEKRHSKESRRPSFPRHSKSLSPGASRRRSSSCRLEIERRARSEGDRYNEYSQPQGDSVPPKPWERRLNSQLKADSMRDSSKVYTKGRSDTTGSPGASMSSKKSKTGSCKPPSTRPDQASLRDSNKDGSLTGRQPAPAGSRQNLNEGTQRTTMGYKAPPRDKPEMPRSRGASASSKTSKTSKTGPHRAPNTMSSKTSKPSDRKRPSYGPGKDSHHQDIHKESSPRQPRHEDTHRPGKVPSEPQRPASSEPCEPDDFISANYDTDNSVLYYARITSNAFPPVKETYHAAGFMLRSAYSYNIPPRSKISVKTDLLLQLPRNSYGRIAPRKCLVENYGVDVVADVIDRDYKGNITVVLLNHGDRKFTIERGNKIAQLICESIHLAKVVENNNLLT